MKYYYTYYKEVFQDGFKTHKDAQKNIEELLCSEVESRCANEYDPEILVEDFVIKHEDEYNENDSTIVDNGLTQEDVEDSIHWRQKELSNSGDPMTSEEFYRMVM